MSEVILLAGASRSLVGIVSTPDELTPGAPAFVLLNAGYIHRIGPHRLHVRLARRLAASGWLACRFDQAGIGDSGHMATEGTSLERGAKETIAFLDALTARYGVTRFVLMGICTGADVAGAVAERDERIVGVALINSTLGETEQAGYRAAELGTIGRLYRSRLSDPSAWLRLLMGRSRAWRALPRLVAEKLGTRRAPKVPNPSTPRLETLRGFGSRALVIASQGSIAFDLLRRSGLRAGEPSGVRCETLRADHVFTSLASQRQLVERIEAWCSASFVSVGSE